MYRHYIILSSSYSQGMRIGIHYLLDDEIDPKWIMEDIDKIREVCGDTVSISTHFIETKSPEWMSVVQKDAFFADVYIVQTLGEFIGLISDDRTLQGIDIAKYILSKISCTHLKLEKLVYLCYAEYLCKTDKRLFDDKIYAFKYGPVVETVYEKYRGSSEKLEFDIDDKYEEMPIRSRILFAEDGICKIDIIEQVLYKYGGCTVGALVDMTHKPNSPWDCADKRGMYSTISDDLIRLHHCFEIL